jgi:UDP-3-O-[3-hydroxymyristoyl] glucosamine N-acyltransferase
MEFSAATIASWIGATIEGNPDVLVNSVCKIEEGTPGGLSFLANPQYTPFIYETKASCVIVATDFVPERPISATLLRVAEPYRAFAGILEQYSKTLQKPPGIEQPCFIHPDALIGKDVYIGAFAYIGKGAVIGDGARIFPQVYIGDAVSVGAHSTLHPGVKVYDQCRVGNHCTIHAGAIIGADGFGFAPDHANNYKKVPQIGNVILEDHVEIGANTAIDRATLGSTIIRKGVKLDNLIQIAHNVEIGENTVIAAQTGVAGSTKIGRESMIGGQVGIIGHLHLADKVKIAAQSGIGQNIKEEGAVFQGSPAFPISDYQKSYIMFRKLPKIDQRIFALEKQIAELKSAIQAIAGEQK